MKLVVQRLSTVCLLLVLTAPFVATARAQDAPKRCGGLLCDMGMFGGSGSAASALPCNDFFCRAFGGRQADAAPVAVVEPPPPPVEPAPMKRHAKAKHAAKIAMKPATAGDGAAARQ